MSERTIDNWIARYIKRGPAGLVFPPYRGPASPRIADESLRDQIPALVRELPGRSVAGVRRLLSADAHYAPLIAKVSDRTIYRFHKPYQAFAKGKDRGDHEDHQK